MDLHVPENLYGMAIVAPAQGNWKHDGIMLYLELLRVYMTLCFNYIILGLFILEIHKLDNGGHVDCSLSSSVLEMVCVFVFEARMLLDILESASLISILYFASAPKEGFTRARDASPGGGVVLEHEAKKSWLSKISGSSKQLENVWDLDGISYRFRAFSLLFVALPKVVLAVTIAYVGGVYIIKSPDQATLVMNTLAVVFLSEIDEILYQAFTSEAIRRKLRDVQLLEIPLTNTKRFWLWFMSAIIYPALMVAGTLFVMAHARYQECPNFQWSWQEIIASSRAQVHGEIFGD